MALTKTKTKPASDARKRVNNFLFTELTFMPINKLKPHPKNPNTGDVDSIQESLDESGMYRPIVFNKRNGYIAAGHHTWLAARKSGWSEIGVVVIDVDDAAHKRIMIADNATAARAERDDRIMAELLAELKSSEAGHTGLGLDQDEIDAIMWAAEQAARVGAEAVESAFDTERELAHSRTFEGSPLGEEGDPDDEEYELIAPPSARKSADPNDLDEAPDELNGVFQLKPDLVFDHVGWLEITRLRTDMIATLDELPQNLIAWAGSATKDWPDDDQWWLYNYGIDSTSGMKDVSKVVLAFYTFDEYFENWWYSPDKFTSKLLHSRIKFAVTPDFSPHTPGVESRTLSIWNLHRQRWMGRYFQEAGIKIIPNINWAADDEPFLMEHTLPTLPKRPNTIALQIQAMFDDSDKKAQEKLFKRQIQTIFDTVKPKGALIYYGQQGKKFFDTNINPGCDVLFVESRMAKLAEQAKKRIKKKTI